MVIAAIVVRVVTEIMEAIVTEGAARTEITEDIVRTETTGVRAKRDVTELKVRNGVIKLKTKRGITEDIAEKGVSEKWIGTSEGIVRIEIIGVTVEIEAAGRIIMRRID